MKFLIDEDLSPRLCEVLNELGYEATSVRDRGRLGMFDTAVLAWAVEEDRVIITANADDFRELVGREELHPGLWIVPNVGVQPATEFLRAAATFVASQDEDPASYMVNRVVTISAAGDITAEAIPD